MRPSCLDCVFKHGASAVIYLRESRSGYPMHRGLAMAELEHASQESERDYPDISAMLLAERKNMKDPEYQPELFEILQMVWSAKVEEETADGIDGEADNGELDQEGNRPFLPDGPPA